MPRSRPTPSLTATQPGHQGRPSHPMARTTLICAPGLVIAGDRKARITAACAPVTPLLHVINLATGGDYAGCADPAHFAWVTHAWNAVVVPNQVLFIGLLAAFEATAGVLAISGGRRAQLGYLAVIAFYLALWLFGWIETGWVLVMLPAMLLLLRAELRATPAIRIEEKPTADVPS